MEQIESLEQAVARLDQTAGEIHSALRKRTQVFFLSIAVVAIIAAALIGVVYKTSLDNSRAIDANNRRWCPVVEPLAPRPGDPPPQGTAEQQARSMRIRDAFSELVRDFRCTP